MFISTGVNRGRARRAGPEFGRVLRQMRLDAQLTQQELAQRAGISTAAIRDLEQGRSSYPRQRSLRALARALEYGGIEEYSARAGRTEPPRPVVGARSGPAPAGQPVGSTAAARIDVLGPLVVRHGQIPVPTGPGRHQLLLARLALTPNTMVYRDEMVDLLWGERPPESAVNLVHRYVARVRRILAPDRIARQRCGTLSLVPDGYRLNLTREQLDLLDYQALVTEARTAEPRRALTLLDIALARWNGDPLADVPELRHHPATIALVEEHIEICLWHSRLAEALTGADQVVHRIHQLALRHPLHEPLHARLITLLSATGRRAAAIEVFENIRVRLADELGIRPGALLVSAHGVVLTSDV